MMETKNGLDRALDLAVTMEEESIRLYTSAQEKTSNASSRQFLRELVEEEQKHKTKLLEVKMNPETIEEIGSLDTKIADLKIVDWLEDANLSPEADYQQILIFAGKREKTTHDFYIQLATRYQGDSLGKIFARLAQEELKHKYLLEKEYDDLVLTWM